MIFQTLKVAIIAAALAVCGNATAQDCGSCGGGMSYEIGGSYAGGCGGGDNCGRGINQGYAAGLWAGYCSESCDTGGGRGGCLSGRGGLLRGKVGGGGCGCDMGCFGYPTGGCGCDAGGGGRFSGRARGGCFSGLKGKLGGGGCGNACGGGCGGSGGCRLGGKLKSLFSGGCGRRGGGSMFAFAQTEAHCGNVGAYFGVPVGHEYGNAGIQSCVSGCATGCCDGGVMGSPMGPVMDAGAGTSIMSGPMDGMMFSGGAHDPVTNAPEVPAEVTNGAGAAVEALENLEGSVN